MTNDKPPFVARFRHDGSDIGYEYRRRVGLYVRELREKAGLTQRALGQAVDMGPSMISAIELGRNPIPPERYSVFASVLGVKPRVFGRFLLEHTDPWLFGMIYGQHRLAHHHLDEVAAGRRETMQEKIDRIRKNHGERPLFGN